MTLLELSEQYRAEAAVLQERIRLLEGEVRRTSDEGERLSLQARIRVLSSMWRDTHDIAVLTEHYYERNHCRNAKYII